MNQCLLKELPRIFVVLGTNNGGVLHPKVIATPWIPCEHQHVLCDQNLRCKISVRLLTVVASSIYFGITVVWFRKPSELRTNTV